jgi:hypothetical protein
MMIDFGPSFLFRNKLILLLHVAAMLKLLSFFVGSGSLSVALCEM